MLGLISFLSLQLMPNVLLGKSIYQCDRPNPHFLKVIPRSSHRTRKDTKAQNLTSRLSIWLDEKGNQKANMLKLLTFCRENPTHTGIISFQFTGRTFGCPWGELTIVQLLDTSKWFTNLSWVTMRSYLYVSRINS